MAKSNSLLVLMLLLSSCLFAQFDVNTDGLRHEMTPEERLRAHEIGMLFVETPPPSGEIRNIAEFEPMEGVLVRYPFGITTTVIAAMSQHTKVWTIVANTSQQSTVTNSYTTAGVNMANIVWVVAPSNSYWTRDYGPWFVHFGNKETGIVDFPYNRPRPMDDSIPKVVAAQMGIPWFGMRVIHTGGNYMTLGSGTSASTDLLILENPTQSVSQINQRFTSYLGVTTYHLVADPNNTYIDHIDCWGKYLAPDKVLIRSVPTSHAQYNDIENTAAYFASQPSPYGTPFKLYRVFTPSNQPYTNSLILNKKVFVPIMGQVQYDTAAIAAYQQAMPGYSILGFTGTWESTDALHCRAMGLADRGMLEIQHAPILGMQPLLPQYVLSAKITNYSNAGLYPDSALLYYKINNGNYIPLPLTNMGGYDYEGVIPGQPTGTIISYFLFAADSSGRSEHHPYIGGADPHVFEVGTVGLEDLTSRGLQQGRIIKVTPNPFTNICTLQFQLQYLAPVSLNIMNIHGQKVTTLVDQPLGPGNHFFSWDGTDATGHRMPPGIYLGSLTTGGVSTAVKLILQGN